MQDFIDNLMLLPVWQDTEKTAALELAKRSAVNNADDKYVVNSVYLLTLLLVSGYQEGHVCFSKDEAKEWLISFIIKGYARLESRSDANFNNVLDYFNNIIAFNEVKLSHKARKYGIDALNSRIEEYLTAEVKDSVLTLFFKNLASADFLEKLVSTRMLKIIPHSLDATLTLNDITSPIIYNNEKFYIARSFWSEVQISRLFKNVSISSMFNSPLDKELLNSFKDKSLPDNDKLNNEQNLPDLSYLAKRTSLSEGDLQDYLKVLKVIIGLFFKNPEDTQKNIPQEDQVDWQRNAVCISLLHQICVITGGPGTGKTTSVAKLITIFLLLNKNCRIALAAPTGKAADRMLKSFNDSIERTIIPLLTEHFLNAKEIIDALRLITSSTLHTLIRIYPGKNSAKFNAQNPLPYDILIVDEASMIDISLMHKTMEAIDTSKTKVIFLGDKDQLSSVEAGSILGDICHIFSKDEDYLLHSSYKDSYLQDLAILCYLTDASREDIILSFKKYRPHSERLVFLAPGISTLLKSHRFKSGIGIGYLASLINDKNPDNHREKDLKDFLQKAAITDITKVDKANLNEHGVNNEPNKYVDFYNINEQSTDAYKESPYKAIKLDKYFEKDFKGLAQNHRYNYYDYLKKVSGISAMNDNSQAPMQDKTMEHIKGIFEMFNNFRLLTPVNEGTYGVHSLNKEMLKVALSKFLEEEEHNHFYDDILKEDPEFFDMFWFPGLPYIVTKNDSNLNLANGDIGICHFDKENFGSKRVWFENGVSYPISLLAHIEVAFAMTIHKSQGSEFTHTAVVIPNSASRLISKELFYTAVTRAKAELSIFGDIKTLTEGAAVESIKRHTGLKERLYSD